VLDPTAPPDASYTLLVADGDVSGRFASVPAGYAVEVLRRRVVLFRTTERRASEGICSIFEPMQPSS
jgi:hypothetical protein